MPVGDQHHGGIAIAIAIGPAALSKRSTSAFVKDFARPHLGIAYALRWPISRIQINPPSL